MIAQIAAALLSFAAEVDISLSLGSSATATQTTCDTYDGSIKKTDGNFYMCQNSEDRPSGYGSCVEWSAPTGGEHSICAWQGTTGQNLCRNIDGDAMNCGCNTPACLKWGAHIIAGQMVIPPGVRVDLYYDWDCQGTPDVYQQAADDDTPKMIDFWDFYRRAHSIKFHLVAGSECKDGQITNAKLEREKKCPTVPVTVNGYWQPVFDHQAGNKRSFKITVGRKTTEGWQQTKTFSDTVTRGITAGYKAGSGGGLEATVSSSNAQTWGQNNMLSGALEIFETREESFEAVAPGRYWQWVFQVSSEDSDCNVDAGGLHALLLPSLVYTTLDTDLEDAGGSANGPPCCPPGLFRYAAGDSMEGGSTYQGRGICVENELDLCGRY